MSKTIERYGSRNDSSLQGHSQKQMIPVSPHAEFDPAKFAPIGHYRNVRGLGKSMVVFRLFEKLRYSNERSTNTIF